MSGDATARPRVAYQGEPGAFSEEAALAYFDHPIPIAVPSWRAVFEGIRDGDVDSGVVAIENSLGGSIRETYDLLYEFDLRIVGEVTVAVRLALMALPGQTLEDIDRVYSHPQGIAQADEFLRTRPWSVMTAYNTAGSAKMILGSWRARRGGASHPRAWPGCTGSRSSPRTSRRATKTGPGSRCCRAMRCATAGSGRARRSPRARRSCSRCGMFPGPCTTAWAHSHGAGSTSRRLNSRPSRAARWEYVFWADLDAAADDPECAAGLDELRSEAAMVRVLGSYPRAAED